LSFPIISTLLISSRYCWRRYLLDTSCHLAGLELRRTLIIMYVWRYLVKGTIMLIAYCLFSNLVNWRLCYYVIHLYPSFEWLFACIFFRFWFYPFHNRGQWKFQSVAYYWLLWSWLSLNWSNTTYAYLPELIVIYLIAASWN
jgi:hypothetical protein